MKTFSTKRKAFTLIELLIVIAIIGILFIVLVSKVDFATDKAKASGVQTDFRSFQLAFDTVAREQAGFSELVDGNYDKLEVAINKNLDAKLHIDIDDSTGEITMLNGALDPWGSEYHGKYLQGDDGKDRGAIVMYSNGPDFVFGSNATIAGGIVTIATTNDDGKDDYAIVSCYSYMNGYGEIFNTTTGFSNNQSTQGNISNNSGTEGTEDPDVTELLEPGLYNAGAIALAENGDVEAAQDMKKTSWNDLLASGIVHVTNNGIVYSNFVDMWTNESAYALDGDLVLPNDGSITSIGDAFYDEASGDYISNHIAFQACDRLTGIAIPDSVTSIGHYAFAQCTALTSVTISNSVTSIGAYVFKECWGLTSITIGNSVTSIGQSAFYDCDVLTNITIPDSVTEIGNYAFNHCDNLTNVTIGNSVTSIGDGAFSGCQSLTSITIPDSVTSLGESAFSDCCDLTSITIGNSVTSIGKSAFWHCTSLKSITIPNGVTTINSNTFSGCSNLRSVNIPNSVTSIGGGAFQGCQGLTSITIPDSVTEIGNSAFNHCCLTSITIPNGVTYIGNYTFYYCYWLESITIPDSVTSIGNSAFQYCENLKSITFNGSIEQWSSISKQDAWNDNVPATYVQCTDGQVTLK